MCLSRFGDATSDAAEPKVATRRSRNEASDGQAIGGASRRHGHNRSSERCPRRGQLQASAALFSGVRHIRGPSDFLNREGRHQQYSAGDINLVVIFVFESEYE